MDSAGNSGRSHLSTAAYSAVRIVQIAILVASALALLALGALIYNVVPYALAPFYVASILSTEPAAAPSIEGQISDEEKKRRVKSLRAIAASPQAVASSADWLTIVGVAFESRLRSHREGSKTEGGEHPDASLAAPFKLKLDLSRSDRSAIVALSDYAIAWDVVPSRRVPMPALFGIESRLFPEVKSPPGVLAGFRLPASGEDQVAKPIDPYDADHADEERFCHSALQWARYFAVPIERLHYLLIRDPTRLEFDGTAWTSDGKIAVGMEFIDLQKICGKYDRSSWKDTHG